MRLVERAWHRVRSLFGRAGADTALAAEIALHLEEATREGIARGLSPDEARAEARRGFGSIALIEDQCRDTRRVGALQRLAQDARYGLRSLLAQPLLVGAASASIGAGAGATALVFALASALLFATPTVRDPHDVVAITLDGNSHVSYAAWRELDESGALGGLTGFHIEGDVNVRDGDRTVAVVPMLVPANFFDVLGVPIALGRGFTRAEAEASRDPRVAVVSDRFWRARLGADPRAVGGTVVVNGEPYTVLGVLPAGVRSVTGFGLAPELYLPLRRALLPSLDHPQAAATELIGRLRPGQSLEAGRASLDTVVQRRHAVDRGQPARVGRFQRLTDGNAGLGSVRQFLVLLLVVGGLVLGIACANVTGLLLARNSVRQKELALRASLGASRHRLLQQLLVEAVWLALFGTAAGFALMQLAMWALASVPLPLPLPLDLRTTIDWRLFALAVAIVSAAALISGVAPALQGSRAALVPSLRHDAKPYVHRRVSLRGALVVGQVAVAAALVVTALIFVRNLTQARALDPGFDTAHTLVAQVGLIERQPDAARRLAVLTEAVRRAEALPGVTRAAFARGMPLTIRHGQTTGMDITLHGGGAPIQLRAHWAENAVGEGFFATLGIPVLTGREFSAADDAGAPRVAVVNQAFVDRYLQERPPLGMVVHLHPAPVEIVGVVGNSRHRTLGEAQMAALYRPYRQAPPEHPVVHVMARTTTAPRESLEVVRAAIAAVDPTAAVDVQTVSQSLAFAFLPSRLGAALVGGLGAIALALALAGLFALVSYAVSRRTKEIGVRLAIGASAQSIVRLVAGDALAIVAIGTGAGLTIAFVLTPPLALFLVDGLSPRDPIAFAAAAALFGTVGAGATLPGIRRALGMAPLEALRTE
jgi:putative ABC transport system permease protein